MKETRDLKDDIEAKCESYSKEKSYKNCVLAKINKDYLQNIGCSPPWFTNDYDKVCNSSLSQDQLDFLYDEVYRHIDQTEFEGCIRPCIRMEIQSRLIRLVDQI